ncbi:hypothetical protein E4U41_005376 [Claviceps citrina]|nr:hypothetical protein E4U41_005376 [Claviceps citrina]
MNNTSSDQDVLRKVGRGGAGNLYSVKKQDELAPEEDPERQHKIHTRPAAAAPNIHNTRCAGGRGGAGNWAGDARGGEDHHHQEEEEEEAGLTRRRRIEELDRTVAHAVGRDLRVPERVHHHHGREKDAKQ